ncbi:MAG: hypothetical protein GEU99_18675 [Luteitalea sp.]|nr:hypothetical protein [Luteitalea sp.]
MLVGTYCYLPEAMPSPVGHALAGLAVGLVATGRPGPDGPTVARLEARGALDRLARDPMRRRAAAFAMLGALPDVDLIVDMHSTYTHSIGAVAIVLAASWLILQPRRAGSSTPIRRPGNLRVVRRPRRLACAAALAYASHILLDWLGHDPTLPIGVTALWPFSTAYYDSGLHLFMPISRRYWLDTFWSHNLVAVARELLLLVPCAVLAWWWATRRDEVSGARGQEGSG